MTITISAELQNESCDALVANIGNGSKVQIRTGAPSLSASGTLLGEVTLGAGFSAASAGSASATGGPWYVPITVAGDAGHFRITKTDGTTGAIVGTIDDTGSPDATIPEKTLVVGEEVRVNSISYTVPANP